MIHNLIIWHSCQITSYYKKRIRIKIIEKMSKYYKNLDSPVFQFHSTQLECSTNRKLLSTFVNLWYFWDVRMLKKSKRENLTNSTSLSKEINLSLWNHIRIHYVDSIWVPILLEEKTIIIFKFCILNSIKIIKLQNTKLKY